MKLLYAGCLKKSVCMQSLKVAQSVCASVLELRIESLSERLTVTASYGQKKDPYSLQMPIKNCKYCHYFLMYKHYQLEHSVYKLNY